MAQYLLTFCSDERGQDVAEYTMILATLLISAAIIVNALGIGINTVWQAGDTQLGKASNYAGS